MNRASVRKVESPFVVEEDVLVSESASRATSMSLCASLVVRASSTGPKILSRRRPRLDFLVLALELFAMIV